MVDGPRWRALVDGPEVEEEEAPAPLVSARTVRVAPVEEGVRIEATWTVHAPAPGWFTGRIVGPGAHVERLTWDGRPAAASAESQGVRVAGWVEGTVRIDLVAVVPGDVARGVDLALLPAARGTVEAPEGLEVETGQTLARVADAWWTGAEAVRIVERAPPPAARGTLAVGRAAVGITVGEGELTGNARLVWEVRRGALDRVAFTAAEVGADLDVTGPDVRSWQRVGDRVEVRLREPVEGRLVLEASWTRSLPPGAEAALPAPRVRPVDVFRVEQALQLARTAEIEVAPDLPSWQPLPASALPEWARGLVEGTPTASFVGTGQGGGRLALLRYEPVPGPPAVVDVAQWTAALSDEGRMLVRGHLLVRNERASHLRVRVPAGLEVLSVQVGGEAARPVRESDGTWRVPLLRSVETVEGLLSFPVEVALLGDVGADWDRREARTLALPSLDAEVAVSRAVLYLPPSWRSRLEPGEHGVVDAFTEGEGLTYGFALGDARAAEADALFQEAVGAWMSNEFDDAQEKLDALRDLGGENENVQRLQSNLDMLSGGKADEALERRVKEQARARAVETERQQQEVVRKAKEKAASGDYASASSYYREAIVLSGKLEKLEQDEQVEYEKAAEELSAELEQVKEAEASKKQVVSRSAGAEQREVLDFEGEEIEGALVRPDSPSLEEPPPPPAAAPEPEDDLDLEIAASPGVYYKRSRRISLPRIALGGRKEASPEPPADAPEVPEVLATSLSIVVPAAGEAVRYQALLLPPGATPQIHLSAIRTR